MDEAARAGIEATLHRLKTEVFPRADSLEQAEAVAVRLRTAPDLEAKLVIAGFTLEPILHADLEQKCETCINFQVNRRFCDQAELQLPVEPEWSCRIWKI